MDQAPDNQRINTAKVSDVVEKILDVIRCWPEVQMSAAPP